MTREPTPVSDTSGNTRKQTRRIRNIRPQRRLSIGLIAALVAIFAITPAASAATTGGNRPLIVGVGDSFTSGEGNPPFLFGTDTTADQCHRSLAAYPYVVARMLRARGRDIACSGAQTKDLFATFKSESPQVSRLGNADDVVTTIGGNDVNALQSIENPPSSAQFAAELQALEPVLVSTYQKLQAAAPNAQIFAVAYPSLIGANATSSCPLSTSQRQTVITATEALDQTIQTAATQAHVNFVNDFDAFTGHELCTSDPWVNGVNLIHPSYSLHPNEQGQMAIARSVAAAISAKSTQTHHCKHPVAGND
jgi:lysophospholipase L1-like esterase